MTLYNIVKRFFDLLISAILLLALLPLLAVIALLLRSIEGKPVLFRQLRMGRGEIPFTLFKFRTMRDGSNAVLHDRPVARRHNEPLITPVGRLLRRSGLDELPQLWNVIRGEMSLVGPRPLPAEDLLHAGWLNNISDEERERRETWRSSRQTILPGLSGSWQISTAPEEDFENWMTCDLYYIAHRSCWLDMIIILQTPLALLRGRKKPPPH